SRQNNHRLGLALIRKEWRPLLDELLGPDPAFPHINADARALYAQRQFSQALDAFPPACRHERAALHVLETGGSEEKAVRAVDILQRRFWFTALQSSIFNSLLAERIQSGTLGALRAGDIAAKAENSAMFRVTADDENNPELAGRLARFEVAPTGPLWGARMMRAEGPAGEAERRALHNAGLSEDDLLEAERQLGDSMGGARRAYRVPIRDSSVEGGVDEHGHFVQVAFSLPPGAFATVVLREIMKNPGTLWTDSASPAAASAAEEAAE
ncbi:MAG: tRNA pseudouridine(13) synthase TruD, partial [Planctomycetota bacterium]|nr:tRNA pseudouridine(13) synthase TruD [Planctomycetota bacterium]